uniref:Thioredoxin domain-containing protein n=1 Tax=Arion vulgaris TaxID=1028688 RepID=A0A0B6Z5D8_9EUPU
MFLSSLSCWMLTVTMVMNTCLIGLHCAKVRVEEEEEDTETSRIIRDIDHKTWQQSYNENQKLLVLLYPLNKCDKCTEVLKILTQIQENPHFPNDLKIVKSVSSELVAKLEIKHFPSLIYLRSKSYVSYDGNYDVQDLLEWVRLATRKITQRLDDSSFENLIKAPTEGNPSNWLVAFYKEACKSVLPVVETFGVRFHGQVNVAKVNIFDSPKLTHKFKVTNCPEILFFKQGEMYKYKSSILEASSLRDFVDKSFNNLEPKIIPETDFGYLPSNLTDYIKAYSHWDNSTLILAGVCILTTILASYIFVCFCNSKVRRRKKVKKSTKKD